MLTLFILLGARIFPPLVWLVLNSFKSNNELFRDSLALPQDWLVANYAEAWAAGSPNTLSA